MLIANPIYDTVFKRLMENKRIASFFVETLIGEQVEDIAMVPQEYTYDRTKKKEKEGIGKEENWVILSVIRFDFVATIRTAGGENKKVLIEIQKSNKPGDLMRFRTYLGEQYRRIDMVEVAGGKIEKALPIISIYLLGFTIPEIKATAIKVNRTYMDMIAQTEIKQKSEWIESLTHDGYFVQIPLIKGKPRTSLEKLLSVFEQQYFFDDKKTVKDYEYPIDDDNVKTMVEVLRHAAADAKTKREMEAAWFEELNEKEYERMEEEIEAKDKIIAEKDKSLAEKDKIVLEQQKRIAELERLLGK
ncbi:MAG: hypothetical protein FWF54_01720 [Candidatus Azobacteroides sp.]|nr:hypothetical protein [Candidatus Azobacteroides sp.]